MFGRRDVVSLFAVVALAGSVIGCGGSTQGSGSEPASCDPTSTTLGANGGPDGCRYGQACGADTHVCEAVQNGGCAEASASGASSWTADDTSAPVVVSAEGLSTGNSSACPGVIGIETFTIRFYAPGGLTTAANFSSWRNAIWIDVDANGSFQHPDVNLGGSQDAASTFGTVQVGFCGIESRPAAVFLQNDAGQTSNTVCLG